MALRGGLHLNASGEDVRSLHSVLIELGYTISEAERQAALYGPATHAAIVEIQGDASLEETGIVDDSVIAVLERKPRRRPRTVRGTIRQAVGKPIGQLTVRAFDQSLRHEEPLGEAQVHARADHAQYEIAYEAKQARAGINLIVRVTAANGTQTASSVLFNAPRAATIDLVVGGATYLGPSEYEKLVARVQPALDHVEPRLLTTNDITWLAQETGLDSGDLSFYALASSLAYGTKVPVEAFYGLLRQGLPYQGNSLLQRPPADLSTALTAAIAANTIGDHDADWVTSTVAQLSALASASLLGTNQPSSPGAILTAAGVPTPTQQAFAAAYLSDPDNVWTNLTQSIGAASVTSLQTAISWGQLTLSFAPLVAQLVKSGAQPSQVAAWTTAQWQAALTQLGASGQPATPPNTRGATDAEKQTNYIVQIQSAAAQAFPMATIAASLAGISTFANTKQYLDAHPDWDIDNVPAATYVATHTTDAATATALAQLQRVHRVTKQASWTAGLIASQFTSAQAIARAGLGELSKAMGGASTSDAELVRARAGAIVDVAAVLHARISGDYNMPAVPTIPRMEEVVANVAPDYVTTFGPPALCSCDECASLLGPAAYLVDLFQFLQVQSTDGAALTQLFNQRPDLKGIQLSCQNTLTPMPLIDLAIELLEDIAASQPLTALQTTWSADDLTANPEHLNYSAYDNLKTETWPWTLPFDLPLEEARIYLQHLGVSRYEVMTTLMIPGSPSTPDETTLAVELLGMSRPEWDSLTNGSSELWDSLSTISSVEEFLSLSGLAAADLPPLLNSLYVNPPASAADTKGAIGIDASDGRCNPNSASFTPALGQQTLDRIRRFVRLSRRLGWSFADLDSALTVLTAGTIDANLTRLARFERVRRQTQLPIPELLRWWRDIDNTLIGADGRTEYADIFLSHASASTDSTNSATPDPLVLPSSTPTIGGALPRIIAALNLTGLDVDTLLRASTPNSNPGDGLALPLTLSTLSSLYRAMSLSRAAGLSSADYARLRRLSTLDPFAAAPATIIDSARQFLDLAAAIKSGPLSLAEWCFLLRGEAIDRFVFDTPGATGFLTELRAGLLSINANYATASADPDQVTIVRRKLATLVTGDDLAVALAFLDAAPGSLPAAALPRALDSLAISSADASFLEAPPPSSPPSTTDIQARYQRVSSYLLSYLEGLDKQSLVLKSAMAATGLELRLTDELIREPFVNTFVISGSNVVQSLSEVLLEADNVENVPLDSQTNQPVFAANNRAFVALTRFGKQALLASRLGIVADEVLAIQPSVAGAGWLDWNQLPAVPADAVLDWSQASALLSYFTVRNGLPGGLTPLWQLFSKVTATPSPSLQSFLVDVAAATGWDTPVTTAATPPASPTADAPNLDALATTLGISAPFSSIDVFVRLGAAVGLAQRMGLPGATIAGKPAVPGSAAAVPSWRDDPVASSTAADIKGAARSKHSAAEWLTIAKKLRDPLREKQRDALLAYAIGDRSYDDVNHVYNTLLVDVQMSACMLTSRIKQAISSTQLFIERCLLKDNSDPDTAVLLPVLKPEATTWWKWMRDYRVWEANREVFIYPENWLQPELRTDKTPFFQDLENELHQQQLTSDVAEDALHHYLEKLDQVAKLQIVGFVEQPDAFQPLDEQNPVGDLSAVHVIGRTPAPPYTYFYRRLERGFHWTPWEQIKLDINSDIITPVLWHRRLFLFWLQFQIKTDPDNQSASPVGSSNSGGKQSFGGGALPPTPKQLDVTLAWTENKSDRWQPRRSSTGSLVMDPWTSPDTSMIVLHSFVDSNDSLHLQVIWNNPDGEESQVGDFTFGACTQQPEVDNFEYSDQAVVIPPGTQQEGNWFERILPLVDPHSPEFAQARQSGATTKAEITAYIASRIPLKLLRGYYTENDDFEQSQMANTVVPVLQQTQGRFHLSWPHDYAQFTGTPLFYWDDRRVYYVNHWNYVDASGPKLPQHVTPAQERERELAATDNRPAAEIMLTAFRPPDFPSQTNSDTVEAAVPYVFHLHYHPYACAFLEQLDRYGVDGFYAWHDDPAQDPSATPMQLLAAASGAGFKDLFLPTTAVKKPYPDDQVEFSACGAYSPYNWEVFLHIPVYVANLMRTQQSFEEALRWLHFVYDPTNLDTTEIGNVNWKMPPLRQETAKSGDFLTLLQNLDKGINVGADPVCPVDSFTAQIAEWRNDPFDPHAVARLRPVAYMKWVFNLYVQTLIDWGDQLFKQNTLESINLATLRYVMAARLLGTRPDPIPNLTTASPVTYSDISGKLDAFSDALENLVPGNAANDAQSQRFTINYGQGEVFCVPPNDQLYTLWDTVADRLFKIRHCMNIEGQVEQLPLFEPPINPALLIAAQQAGVDLSSAVNGAQAARPRYRFGVVYERARELVGELRSLGNALQAALEKRDGEDLALLRSSNEIALLTAVRDVKQRQLDEANAQYDALVASQAAMQERVNYYQEKSQELANASEGAGLVLLIASQIIHAVAGGIHSASSALAVIPQFNVGVSGIGGTPTATFEFGGEQIKGEVDAGGIALTAAGDSLGIQAGLSTTLGGWQRRQDEMTMQFNATSNELTQIQQQVLAASIRQDIAQKDLDNHDLQIQQSTSVDTFLHSKFTNRDLFDWMAGQVSAIYFQTYQLAFDMARRAESAFRFELGIYDDTSTFIQFGYWDNLRQGLLAGDKLGADLLRLQATYIEENQRELELTKHISLALTDPIALLALRQDGACYLSLSELLFDLDMPGLYLRRIKSLSLSIPCVSGSYTTVACKLTLLKDTIRTNSSLPADLLTTNSGTEAIVTSTAQNDAGLFEVNLRDERYLPFEGAGVISQWKLELVKEAQQFDWTTISDVVLHMRYTARDGGDTLRKAAAGTLSAALKSGVRLFSVRNEFPDAFAAFLNPAVGATSQTLTLDLSDADFPYPVQGQNPKLSDWVVVLRGTTAFLTTPLALKAPGGTTAAAQSTPTGTLTTDWGTQGIVDAVQAFSLTDALGVWTFTTSGVIPADQLDDVVIVVSYSA